jgi:hypothetical protein
MTVRIPTSLAGCNDLVKSATAAEMVFALAEVGAGQCMTGEEWREYNSFIEAAVHLMISAIPHYLKPANLGADIVLAVEHYRRDGIDRRPDPAERTATREVDCYDDFNVDDEEGKWGMC